MIDLNRKIQENYLKNYLDSYGISVLILIQFSDLYEKWIRQLLLKIKDAIGDEFTISGFGELPIFHITLFPLLRSVFILPENKTRKKECERVLKALKKQYSITGTDPRIIQAPSNNREETLRQTIKEWHKIQLNIPQHFSYNLDKLIAPKLFLTENGLLYLQTEDQLLQRAQIMLNHVITISGQSQKKLRKKHHIGLGYLKSGLEFQRLKNIVLEENVAPSLLIRHSSVELVAYSHRSISHIIRAEKLC